ncbi:hypothetical protein SDC9_80178 [bioreactor metagenome]|uniref:Late embryogenesis abundant protein LEA-2 subgroup domain-containing protein n=1 Tax=bioreactor metagenome TaxID=1076179 RepID=A0A644Z0R7_9ZZZZ
MGLLKTIFVGGALYLGIKAFTTGAGLSNFYKKMNYYISAKLHSITWNGLIAKVNIDIHNPTDTQVKMTKPYVRIYSGDIEVGHSSPENTEIIVQPHSATKIEDITITIPWGTEMTKLLAKAGKKLVNLVAAGVDEPVGINLTVKAMMDVAGINDIVQTSEVSL